MTEFNQLGLDCEQVISFRDIWCWVITSSMQFKYFCSYVALVAGTSFFRPKGEILRTQTHKGEEEERRSVPAVGTPL